MNFNVLFYLLCLFLSIQLPEVAGKLVIAHRMVTFDTYSKTMDGYKQEIQLAQQFGIDAFVMNIANAAQQYSTIDLIYNAASELNTGFKIAISLDTEAANYSVDEIFDVVKRYWGHSAQLKYQGRAFLSTFRGEANTFGYPDSRTGWTQGVLNRLSNQGIPVYFVPNFWNVDQVNFFNLYPEFDGYFNWEAWPSPQRLQNDISINNAAVNSGKTYMAAISPWFYVRWSRDKNWYQGNYDWAQRWIDLITQVNPEFIEIVTWNDFTEGTYIGTWPNARQAIESNVQNNDHEAFGQLGRYFIKWYKSGAQPIVQNDQIYFWYRRHMSNAVASNDPLGLPDWRKFIVGDYVLEDVIQVVVLLKSPAIITISTGNKVTQHNGVTGLNRIKEGYQEGDQKVSISRDNIVHLEKVGRMPVSNNIERYDFGVFADFAIEPHVCAIPKPGNQREDCGAGSLNESGCIAAGCCWSPLENYSWCYKQSGSPVVTVVNNSECAVEVRQDCGNRYTTKSSCENDGCCWNPKPGSAYCFYKRQDPACVAASEKRIECGNINSTRNSCIKDGCCWDPKVGSLYCFEKQIV